MGGWEDTYGLKAWKPEVTRACLVVTNAYRAYQAAEKVKAHVDSISSKINIENLCKFAVVIDNKFEKHKNELSDEYAQFMKQTKDLKKKFAVTINMVKQAEKF